MYINTVAFTLGALASMASAAPATSSKAVKYVDMFDSFVGKGLPTLVDSTAEGAMHYNAFEYFTPRALIVKPASSPNVITSGLDSQLREGNPAFYPKNSSITAFDLTRICYYCQVNAQQPDASVVEPCTIQLAGVVGNNVATVVQELVYNQTGLAATMDCVSVDNVFRGLSKVDVELVSSLSPATITTFGFDNVAYTAYYKK